jgi:hypothetical protein
MFTTRRERLFIDFMRSRHSAARRRFIRSAVIGVGFLSGLWTRLGFDPGTWVRAKFEAALLAAHTGYERWIEISFLYGPIVLTTITMLLIYRRAGLWGFVAVGLAYAAGILLSVVSVALIALAFLIAVLSVRRS